MKSRTPVKAESVDGDRRPRSFDALSIAAPRHQQAPTLATNVASLHRFVHTAPGGWRDGFPTVALMAQTCAFALLGLHLDATVPKRVARTLHALRSRADAR